MGKYITDERTGLKYELVGDYYLIAGDDEPEERPIGIWGQRHLRHLKQHHKTVYTELMTSGKLNGYLADLNEQAEDMFLRLVKELAAKEGITETLKVKNQMLWVQRMNEVRETATEIINNDLIYT
ncbi:MAG: TnpV protein [Oscillospiraceae bacterium]|nr:TnpV protein [Clostridiales bacterium]HCH68783.1 TnpV protein [Clostridiales bacterium]